MGLGRGLSVLMSVKTPEGQRGQSKATLRLSAPALGVPLRNSLI